MTLKKSSWGIQRTSSFFFLLSQITIAAMMLTTAYDTIMRYFFARPTVWSVELNEVLLVSITLLAGAELVKKDLHIQMDLLYTRLSGQAQWGSRVLTAILGILFCAFLFWYGLQTTITNYLGKVYAAGAFRLPLWMLYAFIPLGMFFMGLEFLLRLIDGLKSLEEKGDGA